LVALVLAPPLSSSSNCRFETIGTRFGGIPSGLPHFAIPNFALILFTDCSLSVTVAMLGAIESLMSAVVSDRLSNDRHNPKRGVVRPGRCEYCVAIVWRAPCDWCNRADCNQHSGREPRHDGGHHPLVHVAVHVLFASPLVRFVPMAVLAGILMVVSYNMGEWREIPQLLKLTKTDISVWLVTFALTVFADLTVAVSRNDSRCPAIHHRVAGTTTVSQVTSDYVKMGACISCKIKIFRITPLSSAFTGHFCSAQR